MGQKIIINSKRMYSAEGGTCIRLTNKTGNPSVKGEIVAVHETVENAVKLTEEDTKLCMGVFYEGGVADGSECWVAIHGIVEVMLENDTTCIAGNWVIPGVAGRADATATAPPGGSVQNNEIHFGEIGHCLEDEDTGGTDILVKIDMHFN